ncbi:MAG: carboxypeptidase-like regulatory domain-containing protein [Flavobacteriaceae bacterium]
MKLVLLWFVGLMIGVFNPDVVQITGTVVNDDVPLPGVKISVVDGSVRTTTDKDGKFSLTAKEDDIIQFSHVRMAPMSVKVEKSMDKLLVKMQLSVANLPEVTVESKAKRDQRLLAGAYEFDYNIIKSKFGYLDKNKSVYSMRIFEGDKLFKGAPNFLEALRILMPQIRVVGRADPAVYLRPNNSFRSANPVVYDLDGQLLFTPPTGLAITEIDRIAVITSTSIGAKYGAPASGGIIIINTKESY